MKRKRVLIVVPYNNGTIAMCSRNLYNAMRERDDLEVKAVIVHRFEDDRLPEFEDTVFCVTKEAHPLLKWTNLIRQIIWLRRIKKSFKPDITISTLGGCSTINVLSGGSDRKVGIFHSPHSQARAKGIIIYLNTLMNFKYVYPKLSRLACVSTEVKNSILDNFPWFHSKDVRVVYNVHNFDDIFKKAKDPLTVNESNIVDDKTLLYIGRFDDNKAPQRALKAFQKCVKQLPDDAKLCFIGKDEQMLQYKMEKLIDEQEITDRVHFLGFQSNPYKFLSRAKGLISCSYSEGLPGVMIESLLLGKPIVTTNSSEGIWEIMSCHDSYDKQLESIHSCKDGVITSNLAFLDKNYEEVDINNLSLGIQKIFKEEFKSSFYFKKLINKDLIISELIE